MKQQHYHNSAVVHVTPEEAMRKIINVPAWWSENFEGKCEAAGDVFTVRFGKIYKTFKVTELSAHRMVWEVIDCHMPWLSNIKEWNGTSVVWEISKSAEGTVVSMTHIGLVPEVECYNDCRKGWNYYFEQSLLKWITDGKGMPEMMKKEAV